jgi:tetratricopeptide (TPR) repeat protein
MFLKRTARSLPFAILLFTLFFGTCLRVAAQTDRWGDSLKRNLAKARDDGQRIQALLSLSLYNNNIDSLLAEQYAHQAIEIAELSRDRKQMVKVYLRNGDRFLNNAGLYKNTDQAIDNYRQGEQIARESGLEDELVECYSALSQAFRSKGANDQALEYSNLAVVSAAGRENDSIKVIAYTSLGDTYSVRNEMLLAFRNYLEALDVAEHSKNSALLRDTYVSFSYFYTGLHAYDTAIDFRMKALEVDRNRSDESGPYSYLEDYRRLGDLFSKQEKYDLALKMYEHNIALADTMHFDLYKINSYFSIFAMYLTTHQFQKGVQYINNHPAVMEVVNRSGIAFYVDQFYGSAYSDMGRYDSAGYYFRRAEPFVARNAGLLEQSDFYSEEGNFYKRKGDDANAIVYFLKVREIGKAVKSLDFLQNSARNLDTLYARKGDYKLAHFYNEESGLYSDSIRSLSRATDLLRLGIDNDNRHRERLAREEEANTEHRHNVQYMGFTIGLIILFMILVMLGLFAISPKALRALGFFSFIFLFEFIILLADKQIHEWTHGEPWMILLIKIFLAALLLPLHHWLEHKVIHYLMSRKKIVAPFGKGEPTTAG